MPEWASTKQPKLQLKDPIVTLIGANGWITVTPTHQHRAQAIEKCAYNSEASYLLKPDWMKKHQKIISPLLQFKKVPPFPSLKGGKNMLHLVDKTPPVKSNFSYMDYRHNVLTYEEAMHNCEKNSNQIKRPYEWDQSKFDKSKS